jgi:hypothetical protein
VPSPQFARSALTPTLEAAAGCCPEEIYMAWTVLQLNREEAATLSSQSEVESLLNSCVRLAAT